MAPYWFLHEKKVWTAYVFQSFVGCSYFNPSGLGLKASIETIDNRGDFKVYMQHYAFARGPNAPRGPRREGPTEEGFVSSTFSEPSDAQIEADTQPIHSFHR